MAKNEFGAGETCWACYYTAAKEPMFAVTSKAARDVYYLYEYKDGTAVKIGKDKDAGELVRKHGVQNKMLQTVQHAQKYT